MSELNETAHKILDLAEHYTQTAGFNGFSYRDIQKDLGIKTSSIHYYFPTKQDLAIRMIERYCERYHLRLQELEQTHTTAIARLQGLSDLFVNTATEGKFCVCGMLAADLLGMPTGVETQLRGFFELNEAWISKVLNEGIRQSEIKPSVHVESTATLLLALLEGGLLIARTHQNPSHYLSQLMQKALTHLGP